MLQSLNFNLFHSFKSNFSNSRFNFHLFIWFYPLFFLYLYTTHSSLCVLYSLTFLMGFVRFVRSFYRSLFLLSFSFSCTVRKVGKKYIRASKIIIIISFFSNRLCCYCYFFICVGLLLLRLWFFPNFYFLRWKNFHFIYFFIIILF